MGEFQYNRVRACERRGRNSQGHVRAALPSLYKPRNELRSFWRRLPNPGFLRARRLPSAAWAGSQILEARPSTGLVCSQRRYCQREPKYAARWEWSAAVRAGGRRVRQFVRRPVLHAQRLASFPQ